MINTNTYSTTRRSRSEGGYSRDDTTTFRAVTGARPPHPGIKDAKVGCLFPWHVWLIATGFAVLTAIAHVKTSHPDDLAAWWIAARIADQGNLDAIYAVDTVDFSRYTGQVWAGEAELIKDIAPFAHPYVHLPLIALVLAPLTKIMTFRVFAFLWAVLMGYSFTFLTAASISLWTRKAVPPAILVAVASAVWVSSAGQMSINLGQTSPFIFCIIAVSLALSQRRPWIAGVLISIAALIKMTPLALIVGMLLFASRRKTGIIALIVTTAGFVGSYLWAGKEVTHTWRETVGWMGSNTLSSPVNSSIDSLIAGTRDLSAVVEVVEGTSIWSLTIKFLILVAVLVGLFYVAGSRNDYCFEIAVTAVLLAGTATAGVVWVHYGLLAVLPLAGAMILHRSWFASAICLLMFPPFGAVFESAERTPLSQPAATLVVLLVPTIILLWGTIRSKDISMTDIADGVRGEVVGWRANEAYPATLSWGVARGPRPPQTTYRVPEMARENPRHRRRY